MKNETEKWSKGKLKKHITKGREELWRPDTIQMLAKWIGLKDGQTVVDVGCGMGFLGYTYFKYFGKGGTYLGVDHSENLVKEATELSLSWAQNGKAEFVQGDAYKLPYPDNSADVVMCQTLLMHLAEPEKALAEMVRVCKKGGRVVCMEPDHVAHWCTWQKSPFELSFEDFILMAKINYYLVLAKKQAGKGDNSIGSRVPQLLMQAGLGEIDMRSNDQIKLYTSESPAAKIRASKARSIQGIKFYTKLENDPKELAKHKKSTAKHLNDQEKEFLSAGGKIKDFESYRELFQRVWDKVKNDCEICLEQIKNKTFFYNNGIDNIYIAIGTKK